MAHSMRDAYACVEECDTRRVSVEQRKHIVCAYMRRCIIKLMQQQFELELRYVSCCCCCGRCNVCRRRTLSNYVLFYTYLLYIFKFSYFRSNKCGEQTIKTKIKGKHSYMQRRGFERNNFDRILLMGKQWKWNKNMYFNSMWFSQL